MPPAKRMGKKTATVVKVEAMTAMPTSRAPSTAAFMGGRPRSRWRWIFSSTTMESSTILPMPSVSPPRVITLMVMPLKCMSTKVDMMEIGIDRAIMRVERAEERNMKMISTASMPPSTATAWVFSMASRMKRD